MARRKKNREKTPFEWINSHNYNKYVFNWCDMFEALWDNTQRASIGWLERPEKIFFHFTMLLEGLVNVNAMHCKRRAHIYNMCRAKCRQFFFLLKIKFYVVKSHVEIIIFRVHNSLIKLGLVLKKRIKESTVLVFSVHIAIIGAMIFCFVFFLQEIHVTTDEVHAMN